MTTLSLSDDLYQQAYLVARTRGQTVDEFVVTALNTALAQSAPRQEVCNGILTMQVGANVPRIDPERIKQLL